MWERLNTCLRRGVRQQANRDPEPSRVIVDSQSVKTAEKKATVADLTAENGLKDANGILPLT